MKKSLILNLIIGIFFILALSSGSILLGYFFSLKNSEKDFNSLREAFYTNQIKEKEEDLTQDSPYSMTTQEDILSEEKIINLEELYHMNQDIVGWISIKGTKIDYPVMYTPEDPEFYLKRNFEKKYSPSGVPFLDGNSPLSPSTDNIIVHGHNMKDGSMFAELLLFDEKEFWESHPTIDFYGFEKKQTFDIIAVYYTEVYNENIEFVYHTFVHAKDEKEFKQYVKDAKNLSVYDTGVTAEYGEQLLTLSTCAYHTENGRFVVLAKEKGNEANNGN